MKAAVLYQARQPLKTEELEMPEVGDDDVLIRVWQDGRTFVPAVPHLRHSRRMMELLSPAGM